MGLVGKDSLGVRLGMEEGVPPTRGLDGVPLGVPGQLSSLRGERMSGVMGLLCTWASTFIAWACSMGSMHQSRTGVSICWNTSPGSCTGATGTRGVRTTVFIWAMSTASFTICSKIPVTNFSVSFLSRAWAHTCSTVCLLGCLDLSCICCCWYGFWEPLWRPRLKGFGGTFDFLVVYFKRGPFL